MLDILPVAIVGVTDRVKDKEDYILTDYETGNVVRFYEGYGFRNVAVIRVDPAIGPMRDEVRAGLPEGWTTDWRGYWGDYIDEKGVKQFSVFSKCAPWDYCFFVRR